MELKALIQLGKKIDSLYVFGEWLSYLHAHDALYLLRHTLSSSFSSLLHSFDRLQIGLMSEMWMLALATEHGHRHYFLCIRVIRSAGQLTLSVFQASAAACSDLIQQVLQERFPWIGCLVCSVFFRMMLLICGVKVMMLHLLKELSPFGRDLWVPL